jgi:uncharacterized membrane protein YjjB (DUF3815 family)
MRMEPWTLWLALGAAPLGFAVLLKARPKDIPWIFATSLIGYIGVRLGTPALGADLGAAAGSLAVGLAAGLYERWGGGPAPVVMVPGVLLLVPGSIGYKGLSSILNDNVVRGLSGLVDTMMIALAIAAGLIVASVILPAQRRRALTQAPAGPS